jgi:dolichyl-phosphate beta-glucosyltransferase
MNVAPGGSSLKARSLSVIIPAFNEERRLPSTISRIHEFLVHRRYDSEIIVVDDGSNDGTSERVATLQASLPLLRLRRHRHNSGKGFAVLAGMRLATREAILFSDADLSTPIEDIERLWASYDSGSDVVIGSRRREDSEIRTPQPRHRRIMGSIFTRMVSLMGLRGLRDTQCGFKLFRAGAIQRVIPMVHTKGFAFDVELLLRARSLGLRIAEVGVRWNDAPGSRVRAVKDGIGMFVQLLHIHGFLI